MRIAIAVLMFVVPFAAAEEPKSWKGELVMPKKRDKDITFGDRLPDDTKVKYVYSGLLPIKVRDDVEGWIRIHDGEHEGWADKTEWILSIDAPAYFNKMVKADPTDTYALLMRGNAWYFKGEYDNAIKDYSEAMRLDPGERTYYNSRGSAWLNKKEYDKAIKDYDEAIRLDPKYALAFYNRGIAWDNKKEYDKAIKDYDEAIRLDPKNAHAFYNRGIAWYYKKEYDKAIKDYDEAIRLDPMVWLQRDYARFLASCPNAKYRDGAKALKLAKAAIEKAGKDADWEYQAAHAAALAETGDFDGAVREQRAALADKSLTGDDKADQEKRLKLYEAKKPYRDED